MQGRFRNPTNWDQQSLEQARIQHQLEIQSHQIERVIARNQFTGQVSGGTIESNRVNFDIWTPLQDGWERFRDLSRDLKFALRVPAVHLSHKDGRLKLHIKKLESPPVSLLELLQLVDDLPELTATLGLSKDNRPILLDFANPDINHVLLTGENGAGKRSLMRTIAFSLAMKYRQSQLQLLMIDIHQTKPNGGVSTLAPITYLPHMLTGICHHFDEAFELLEFLRLEQTYRIQQDSPKPSIFVLINDVDYLLEIGGDPIRNLLREIMQQGAFSGINFILSSERPNIIVSDNIMRANLSLRIVGQMGDECSAKLATSILDTGAEHLLGKGDFLAINGVETTPFQAAYLGDYDLHLVLDDLHRNRAPTLLANPFSLRMTLPKKGIIEGSTSMEPRQFQFDGQEISLESELEE